MSDNDQAFPSYKLVESVGQMMAQGGMTLRDYFAAKAMQGLLSDGWCSDLRNDHYGENAGNRTVATDAYRMADAMLKAREA